MSKIPASSLIVGDDELELRDADAQKKIKEIIEKVNKILLEKLDKTSIVHTTGAAEDKVMSQKAVTEGLKNLSDNKIDKTSIVHTTGAAEDKVMSQKAVTEKFESYGITVVDGYLCMEV